MVKSNKNKLNQFLNCVIYDLLMYTFTLFLAIMGLPCLVSQQATDRLSKIWIASFFKLNRCILGIDCQFQPKKLQMLPTPRKGVIIAAKHQSVWETLALRHYYPNSVGIAKHELFWLPFGWYMWKLGYIPLNRKGHAKALKKLIIDTKKKLEHGYDVLCFPEGTRHIFGVHSSEYKTGIYGLYRYTNAKILPLGLDSGRVWGRKSFYRQSGIIKIMEGDMIEDNNLNKEEFMKLLEQRIEDVCLNIKQLQSIEQKL